MEFFNRHINLIGEEGFKRLRNTTVLVAGVGGLGTVVSEILVRCGLGRLIIIDNGIVDEPDLNRQFFYNYNDLGKFKVQLAEKRLKNIFPNKFSPEIVALNEKISIRILEDLIKDFNIDVISDCVDNFETKFMLDEFSKDNNIYFIHAGINKFFGQVLYSKNKLKEIYKNLNSNSVSKIEIFPPVCFIVGGIISSEIIKFITNKGIPIFEKILTIDAFFNDFSFLGLK